MSAAEQIEQSYRDWRRSEAAKLGLGKLHAQLFADSEVPLHDLEELVRVKGCPPEMAVRILL